jgi:hypothetical protein
MPRKPQPAFRLRLEVLENRELLSATPIPAYSVPADVVYEGSIYSSTFTLSSSDPITIILESTQTGQMNSGDSARLWNAAASKVESDGYSVLNPSSNWQGESSEHFTHFATMYYIGSVGNESNTIQTPANVSSNETTSQTVQTTPSHGTLITSVPADQAAPVTPPSILPAKSDLPTSGSSTTPPVFGPFSGLSGDGSTDTIVIDIKITVEQVNVTSSSSPLVSEVASVPLPRTQVASAKQAGLVIPAADPALSTPVRPSTSGSTVSPATGPDRTGFVGPLPLVAERRTGESSTSPLPAFLVAPAVTPEVPVRLAGNEWTSVSVQPTRMNALPPQRTADEETSTQTDATSEFASVALPLPEGAGLLDGEMPFGLAALERAVRALTGSESTSASDAAVLLRCVVLGSWMLGASLAWAVARRNSALPEIVMDDAYNLGRGVPLEEDLP